LRKTIAQDKLWSNYSPKSTLFLEIGFARYANKKMPTPADRQEQGDPPPLQLLEKSYHAPTTLNRRIPLQQGERQQSFPN
jgi:hypothetical protein